MAQIVFNSDEMRFSCDQTPQHISHETFKDVAEELIRRYKAISGYAGTVIDFFESALDLLQTPFKECNLDELDLVKSTDYIAFLNTVLIHCNLLWEADVDSSMIVGLIEQTCELYIPFPIFYAPFYIDDKSMVPLHIANAKFRSVVDGLIERYNALSGYSGTVETFFFHDNIELIKSAFSDQGDQDIITTTDYLLFLNCVLIHCKLLWETNDGSIITSFIQQTSELYTAKVLPQVLLSNKRKREDDESFEAKRKRDELLERGSYTYHCYAFLQDGYDSDVDADLDVDSFVSFDLLGGISDIDVDELALTDGEGSSTDDASIYVSP